MTRHSYEDAISEQTFDALDAAAESMPEPYRSECLLVLYAAGRLGLRAGEICHLHESWVDWERSIIEIPSHQSCEKGRHGGLCGYCRHQARQSVAKTGVDLETAEARMWSPKTPTAARPVPFDFDGRTAAVVEEFFMFHDGFDSSRSSVNRRVDRLLERAGYPTSMAYPHSLRATAATHHAYRGLSAVALQALLGWSDLSTAQKYIRLSGGATQQALREAHSD